MLFIFIADTHFDSAFIGENPSLRNAELISTFKSAVDYAQAIGAEAVVLGGDLFDSPFPSVETAAAVKNIVTSHSKLQFIGVCGNHDPLYKTEFYNNLPDNFYVFPETITRYDFKDITFYGVSETDSDYRGDSWKDFCADGRFITVSHGDFYPATLAKTGAALCLLGHIHKTQVHTLSNGVNAIYGGCLAGRGFDECGSKGFYVIDSEDMSYRYIDSGARIYTEYEVDISKTSAVEELMQLLDSIQPRDNETARAVLCGSAVEPYTIDCEKLCALFPQFAGIKDKSSIDVNIMSDAPNNTLEGEFIQILREKYENADESEKQKILMLSKRESLL